LCDAIDKMKDGKTAGMFRECSPFKNMQTNSSGAGIVLVGGWKTSSLRCWR